MLNIDVKFEDDDIVISVGGVVKSFKELFAVGEDYTQALDKHSADQTYWGCVAAEATAKLELFDEVDYNKYMSHCRKFAEYVLKATGKKDTIEAKKDMAMDIFSDDRTDLERNHYAQQAYTGYLQQYKSDKEIKEWIQTAPGKDELLIFQNNMYSYLRADPPIYYEDAVRLRNQLKLKSDCLGVVAKAFEQRGFILKPIVDMKREWAIQEGNVTLATKEKFEALVDEVGKRLMNALKAERLV